METNYHYHFSLNPDVGPQVTILVSWQLKKEFLVNNGARFSEGGGTSWGVRGHIFVW
jgi:hypothetical protein